MCMVIVWVTIDCIVVLCLLSVVDLGCGTNGTSLVIGGAVGCTGTTSCRSGRG